MTDATDKSERLAAALRANLKRRKAQARARTQPSDPAAPAAAARPMGAEASPAGLSPEAGEGRHPEATANPAGRPEADAGPAGAPEAAPALTDAGLTDAGHAGGVLAGGVGAADVDGPQATAVETGEGGDDVTWRVRLVASELEAERIAVLVERAVEADGWPVTRFELPAGSDAEPAAASASADGPSARKGNSGAASRPPSAGDGGVAVACGDASGGAPVGGDADGISVARADEDETMGDGAAGSTAGRAGGADRSGVTAASTEAPRAASGRSSAVEAGAGAPAWAARLVGDVELPWAVEVLVFGGSAAEARARIADAVGGDGFGAAITVEPLPSEDWVAKSLEGLPPVREGRFIVRGRHARGGEPAAAVVIEIEAGLAFGTGHHATTVGCLAAIAERLKRGRPRRPLDLGTGTGVLAIGLARLARVAVTASDVDPVAVRVAADNARFNGVGPWVRPFVATGMADRRLAGGARAERFDLVVANILARPLERLAPAIGRALAPRATVVLSGLRVPDGGRIEAVYRRQNLRLVRRDARDGWLTLTFERRA